jgi:hypothetical protein
MKARSLLWVGPVALLVLAARWLTYALAPPSLLANRSRARPGARGSSSSPRVAGLGGRRSRRGRVARRGGRARAPAPAARARAAADPAAAPRAPRGGAHSRELARVRAGRVVRALGVPGSASTASRASSGPYTERAAGAKRLSARGRGAGRGSPALCRPGHGLRAALLARPLALAEPAAARSLFVGFSLPRQCSSCARPRAPPLPA